MAAQRSNWEGGPSDGWSASGQPDDEAWNDSDAWDQFQPGLCPRDVWDAFELDDEVENPQPEYGDFWPEPDDEEQT